MQLCKNTWGDFEITEELKARVNSLATRAAGGNAEAMGEIHNAFSFKIARFVRRYHPSPLPDGYDMEDLLQEAFVVFAELIGDWDGGDFCAFFFGVFPWRLRRHFCKLARAWRRDWIVYLDGEQMDLLLSGLTDIDRGFSSVEVASTLVDLPDWAREVVLLRLEHGLSFSQIAATLGISRSRAYRAWTEALSRIKRAEAV